MTEAVPPSAGERVLAMIEAAAATGAPCPSNFDLAFDPGGCGAASEATRLLRALVARGQIRIEWQGSHRRIVVLATGACTGWTVHRYMGRASRCDGMPGDFHLAEESLRQRRWAAEDARRAHVARWLAAERPANGRPGIRFDHAGSLDAATVAALSGGTLHGLGREMEG